MLACACRVLSKSRRTCRSIFSLPDPIHLVVSINLNPPHCWLNVGHIARQLPSPIPLVYRSGGGDGCDGCDGDGDGCESAGGDGSEKCVQILVLAFSSFQSVIGCLSLHTRGRHGDEDGAGVGGSLAPFLPQEGRFHNTLNNSE